LAQSSGQLHARNFADAFNFGPQLESHRPVRDLINEALLHWPGSWEDLSDPNDPHEAGRLHLQIDKAHHQLGWRPRWSFANTISRTLGWYRAAHENPAQAENLCLGDLASYITGTLHDKPSHG